MESMKERGSLPRFVRSSKTRLCLQPLWYVVVMRDET